MSAPYRATAWIDGQLMVLTVVDHLPSGAGPALAVCISEMGVHAVPISNLFDIYAPDVEAGGQRWIKTHTVGVKPGEVVTPPTKGQA